MIITSLFLYLMAININEFKRYLRHLLLFLITDILFIWFSKIIRNPFQWHWSPYTNFYSLIKDILLNLYNIRLKMLDRWSKTADGFQSRAALFWIYSDFLLTGVWIFFYLFSVFQKSFEIISEQNLNFFLSIFLISFCTLDYWQNRSFYFGDKTDWKGNKVVFVCSALRGNEEQVRRNVALAQYYCYELMSRPKPFLYKAITPFAPTASTLIFSLVTKRKQILAGNALWLICTPAMRFMFIKHLMKVILQKECAIKLLRLKKLA